MLKPLAGRNSRRADLAFQPILSRFESQTKAKFPCKSAEGAYGIILIFWRSSSGHAGTT